MIFKVIEDNGANAPNLPYSQGIDKTAFILTITLNPINPSGRNLIMIFKVSGQSQCKGIFTLKLYTIHHIPNCCLKSS